MDTDQLINEIVDLIPFLSRLDRWFMQGSQKHVPPHCPPHGLPPAQFRTLILLLKHGSINMTQLSDYMMVPRQQQTKIIDALVAKGLVERETDPTNRRAVLINLTPEGQTRLRTLLYSHQSVISKFSAALNDEQKQKMIKSITLFKEVLFSMEQK